jgi:secondary thiamine-phosphate synthase enzyme
MQETISISTSKGQRITDISTNFDSIIKESKVNAVRHKSFSTHTSVAIINNENTDTNLRLDTLCSIEKMEPKRNWKPDRIDENTDINFKCTLLGPSEMTPLKEGKMLIGYRQSPIFCEMKGPRTRKIVTKVFGD